MAKAGIKEEVLVEETVEEAEKMNSDGLHTLIIVGVSSRKEYFTEGAVTVTRVSETARLTSPTIHDCLPRARRIIHARVASLLHVFYSSYSMTTCSPLRAHTSGFTRHSYDECECSAFTFNLPSNPTLLTRPTLHRQAGLKSSRGDYRGRTVFTG